MNHETFLKLSKEAKERKAKYLFVVLDIFQNYQEIPIFCKSKEEYEKEFERVKACSHLKIVGNFEIN